MVGGAFATRCWSGGGEPFACGIGMRSRLCWRSYNPCSILAGDLRVRRNGGVRGAVLPRDVSERDSPFA